MAFLNWLFGKEIIEKKSRKRVFISFAIEDVVYRDYLVEQAKREHSTFYFIDMSVKKKWDQKEWKSRCRTKIKRCHGVIALLSENTHNADGAKWEMRCAREEGVKIIGMHIKKNDRGKIPVELKGEKVILWSWDNLEKFINKL